MATAKVNIIQSILTTNGWISPGVVFLDENEARSFPSGYLEIISVDGAEEVFAPCCSTTHAA